MRAEARREPGWYDLVHSHYWLSGQVGWLASERWGVPLVHSMHTMAKVKNAHLADGDTPDPHTREIGEEQVVAAATRLVANTAEEAGQLARAVRRRPRADRRRQPRGRPRPVHAGRPAGRPRAAGAAGRRVRAALRGPHPAAQGPRRADPRRRAAGRGPRVAPAARGRGGGRPQRHRPGAPRPTWLISPRAWGSPTSSGSSRPWRRTGWPTGTARPSVTAVPSYSESFGLVAVESQACGTPVVAASVGGLRTAVGRRGVRRARGRPRPA